MKRAQRRKYHYIYKVTRFDGKYYYGMHSTDNLEDGYKGSGIILWRSYKKHGFDKHVLEIQEHWFTREDLKLRETEIVNEEMLKDPLCMNLRIGGEGGGGFHNEDHKRKFIESRQGLWSGRKHSEESKRKIKESHQKNGLCKGEKGSQYGTCWVMKDEKSIIIKKEQLNEYLNDGWSKGRKCKHFGTCWVIKDGKSISIRKNQLDLYLADGYIKGRKIKNLT